MRTHPHGHGSTASAWNGLSPNQRGRNGKEKWYPHETNTRPWTLQGLSEDEFTADIFFPAGVLSRTGVGGLLACDVSSPFIQTMGFGSCARREGRLFRLES